MRRFLRIVCLLLALAGCAGLPTGVTMPSPTALPTHGPNPLNNTHWNLVLLNGQPLIPGSSITLGFQYDEIYGDVSCGSYGGPAYATDKQIRTVGVIQDVGVGCTPEALNVQNNAYINVLFANNPTDYRLIMDGSDIQLEILNSNDDPVLVYDAASSSETETPTVWPQGVPPPDL